MTRPIHPLALWRRRVGIGQAELARTLGVSTPTVFRWEHGTRALPRYLWLALAAVERGLPEPGEAAG